MKIFNEKKQEYEEFDWDEIFENPACKVIFFIIKIILGIIVTASIIMLFYENYIF